MVLNQLFDEDGNRVELVGQATTGKEYGEETVNGHRHRVMYRRNYFRVEAMSEKFFWSDMHYARLKNTK